MDLVRNFFPTGINLYVPGMEYASDVNLNGVNWFSLGTPAAVDNDIIDNDIDADATAGTETAQDYTLDGTYGRTITMNMNADPGAAGGVYDVYGEDYLGQPMIERFTHANGSTAVIYGKKAFKHISKVVVVTAATNATTVDLGTGWQLGLPYKGDVVAAKENGVWVPVANRSVWKQRDLSGAQVAAGPSGAWIPVDFPGFIKTMRTTVNMPAGSTNDPALTVELGGTAVTGLAITIDMSDAADGNLQTDTPTTAGYNANNRFRPGDMIELVLSDADASTAATIELELTPTQCVHPVETDPATVSTGDPRGCYEALLTYDGVKEIFVGMHLDKSVNSDGNGGLFGIQHYFA